jgi:hypothetical protein
MNTNITERPVIAMDAVVSSQVAAIGHDAATNTLAVKFPPTKSQPEGSLYHYENVTAEQFAAFQTSESKGSYFLKHIKNEKEKHPYIRIS